jgi:pimeloyl-ACP methyl ester carboxylesterase
MTANPFEQRVHRLPGLVLTDMQFQVPLDYEQPAGASITIFARAAATPGPAGGESDKPWLVFFQGGPGSGAPRPEGNTGWLKRALCDYRVLLLDQRGTGRSTPLTHQTLARLSTPEAQAVYTSQFRADNIIRDAETIRHALLGADGRWSVLGQSFGGFCVTRYLSAAPAGLREAFLTGGLPPLERTVDEIYQATYRRVADRNRRYYERYPEDEELARAIVEYLAAHPVLLPGGGRLTPRRFQQIGLAFGMSYGFEQVHYLLENAFIEGAEGRGVSYVFLRGVENHLHFEENPIYALLHEAEYCQEAASNWSAERVRSSYPEFDLAPDRPVFFTGEMVYPWMFADYAYLQPLQAAAEQLAADTSWPRLYDLSTLQANQVPCAAVIYEEDMYVESVFSKETAATIRGLSPWITNEYDHNGLRADGERILDRLIGMVHGEV